MKKRWEPCPFTLIKNWTLFWTYTKLAMHPGSTKIIFAGFIRAHCIGGKAFRVAHNLLKFQMYTWCKFFSSVMVKNITSIYRYGLPNLLCLSPPLLCLFYRLFACPCVSLPNCTHVEWLPFSDTRQQIWPESVCFRHMIEEGNGRMDCLLSWDTGVDVLCMFAFIKHVFLLLLIVQYGLLGTYTLIVRF